MSHRSGRSVMSAVLFVLVLAVWSCGGGPGEDGAGDAWVDTFVSGDLPDVPGDSWVQDQGDAWMDEQVDVEPDMADAEPDAEPDVEPDLESDADVEILPEASLAFISVPVEFAVSGQAYQYRLRTSGLGEPVFEILEGPDGLSLNGDKLQWLPEASDGGTYDVTVRVTQGEEQKEQSETVPPERSGLKA